MNTITLLYIVGVGLSLILRIQSMRRMTEHMYSKSEFNIGLLLKDILLSLIPIWNYISSIFYLIILTMNDDTLSELIEISENEGKK